MLKKSLYCFLITCSFMFFLYPMLSSTSAFSKDIISFLENGDKLYAKSDKPEQSSPTVRLEFYNNNRNESVNTVTPWFRLYNTGTSDIKLSEVQIRYYYTAEGDCNQNFWCD